MRYGTGCRGSGGALFAHRSRRTRPVVAASCATPLVGTRPGGAAWVPPPQTALAATGGCETSRWSCAGPRASGSPVRGKHASRRAVCSGVQRCAAAATLTRTFLVNVEPTSAIWKRKRYTCGEGEQTNGANLKLTYLLLFETIQTRRRRRKKDFFFFFFTREGEGDIKHGRGEHRREGSKPTGTLRVLRISLTVDFVTLTHTKRGQNVFPPATSPTVTLAAS